jgi:serine/threonine protein kinase
MERPEFIERFRREAKAAGRLRHPNVVDVTDFGFAQTDEGQVAYLVMEYLDGCTLGEILDEEKNLPVSWTLDILEQVCSAVHEAHQQGIIHRDLKPDNIWLEPNPRGGYTVKVLDFGIAKLESAGAGRSGEYPVSNALGLRSSGAATKTDAASATLIHDSISPTLISESATAVQFVHDDAALSEVVGDGATAIMDGSAIGDADQDTVGTRMIGDHGNGKAVGISTNFGEDTLATQALTRVGAVLGTPLYMSPEQCRGERLDARSDVYSLGVIAYQMLSGQTPFTGDFTKVMDAHRDVAPPPLKAKKVRKKLKLVLATALAKDPNDRPQTAEAFANALRSRSEGIWALLRRAIMIYTEHLPKFLGITLLIYLPLIIATLLSATQGLFYVFDSESGMRSTGNIVFVALTIVTSFIAIFCGYLAIGTITWLVNQILAFPLRPVRIRPALTATAKVWKRLLATNLLSAVTILVGLALCFLPGIALFVLLPLVSSVVMMEGLKGFAALKRSKTLVLRSLRTTTAAVAILFFFPILVGGLTGGIVALVVDKATQISEKIAAADQAEKGDKPEAEQAASNETVNAEPSDGVRVQVGTSRGISLDDTKKESGMARIARESLTSLIMLPFQIFLTSLSAIIFALLYLKTRQAGGENLNDLFVQFEETEQPRKKWQERVRQRLIQSGRISSSNKT